MNNGTQLKDRFLTYDGYSIFHPDLILDMILDGSDVNHIYTEFISHDIDKYNNTAIYKIEEKKDNKDFDFSWNIPNYYKNINVLEYVITKYTNSVSTVDDGRYSRIVLELSQFKKYNLFNFLQTLIYIQETFELKNIVKGVGRGSSVASYVLYIIGIHMIDSYKYNLDFSEFIRPEEFN